MTAYYNEIDKYAAQWLRNLIDAGHIAPGIVDERSIEDVAPSDLAGFTQCHFFAGIGVWSRALRNAGWPDSRPVWTGSCPCQPFSAAGKGAGFDDQRHLWPSWHWLIEQCKPPVVFGEQVASGPAGPWLDLVQDDMEGMGYAFGAVPFPAASVGAPHIRDRLYWVAYAEFGRRCEELDDAQARQHGAAGSRTSFTLADTHGPRLVEHAQCHCGAARSEQQASRGDHACRCGLVGDAQHARLQVGVGQRGVPGGESRAGARQATERAGVHVGELADADDDDARSQGRQLHAKRDGELAAGPTGVADSMEHAESDGRIERGSESGGRGAVARRESFWSDADWIACRDGKARPVEPGTFPLAHGAAARVGRLRAYGNAIVAPAATAWIEACMRVMP